MTDVYRDGAIHVQARKCNTCIFRPGNLMHLEEGRVEGMVADCIKDQGVIPCHKHLDAPEQAVCRGFYDNHHADIEALLLGRAMGIIKEVTLNGKG